MWLPYTVAPSRLSHLVQNSKGAQAAPGSHRASGESSVFVPPPPQSWFRAALAHCNSKKVAAKSVMVLAKSATTMPALAAAL